MQRSTGAHHAACWEGHKQQGFGTGLYIRSCFCSACCESRRRAYHVTRRPAGTPRARCGGCRWVREGVLRRVKLHGVALWHCGQQGVLVGQGGLQRSGAPRMERRLEPPGPCPAAPKAPSAPAPDAARHPELRARLQRQQGRQHERRLYVGQKEALKRRVVVII